MATMDLYLRVSRVGGRDEKGDAYKSPSLQRAAIVQWAKLNDVRLGKEVVDEDVSGGKAVKERGLEQLVVRAEQGASDGVLVYRIDRFGRDAVEVLLALKRLTDAKARLVAVQEGLDSSTDVGRFIIGVMVHLAEYHLTMLRAGWQSAITKAVDEGKHISATAPMGYLRRDVADPTYDSEGLLIRNARLVVDPVMGPAVTEAFRLRAAGASHGAVCAFLRERTSRRVLKPAVTGMLRNRVVLGEARGPGGAVNKDAHDPLVDEETWRRVQARNGVRLPRNKDSAAALLRGVVTCAGCGRKLTVMGAPKGGASYVCPGGGKLGDCPAPAAARVRLVDEWIVQRLADDWETVSEAGKTEEERWVAAREDVRKAEAALDEWVDGVEIQMALGAEKFSAGILVRQRAVEDARRALWDLDDPGVEGIPIVMMGDKAMLYELWGDDVERDRRHLARHVAEVRLAKADPARRRWQPVAERVSVRWVGEPAV